VATRLCGCILDGEGGAASGAGHGGSGGGDDLKVRSIGPFDGEG
jgi:hypothetical protein